MREREGEREREETKRRWRWGDVESTPLADVKLFATSVLYIT